MRRWPSLVALAAVGLICGAAIGIVNTAFVPNCGEACAAERLGKVTLWGLALLVAFPLLGQFGFKRTGEGLKQTIAVAGVLSLIALAPPFLKYGYELHQRYWKTAWQSDIPNIDFSMMSIVTRPVSATAYGTVSRIPIKAWERCALGVVTCDKRPRFVEAMCLGSGATVLIEESNWTAFRRIPDEDLPEIGGQPKDMNLCPAG